MVVFGGSLGGFTHGLMLDLPMKHGVYIYCIPTMHDVFFCNLGSHQAVLVKIKPSMGFTIKFINETCIATEMIASSKLVECAMVFFAWPI